MKSSKIKFGITGHTGVLGSQLIKENPQYNFLHKIHLISQIEHCHKLLTLNSNIQRRLKHLDHNNMLY